MVHKQITFCGEEVELDCRQRSGLFIRLNPKSRREIEDEIYPSFRVRCVKRPESESTLNDFPVVQ